MPSLGDAVLDYRKDRAWRTADADHGRRDCIRRESDGDRYRGVSRFSINRYSATFSVKPRPLKPAANATWYVIMTSEHFNVQC